MSEPPETPQRSLSDTGEPTPSTTPEWVHLLNNPNPRADKETVLAGIQTAFNASLHFDNLTEEALTRASEVIEGRASFSSLASWYKGHVDGMRRANFTSQRLESFHEDVLRNGPNMASAIAAVKDFDTTPQVDDATPSPPPRDHAEAQGGEPQENATRAAIPTASKTDTMPYNEGTECNTTDLARIPNGQCIKMPDSHLLVAYAIAAARDIPSFTKPPGRT